MFSHKVPSYSSPPPPTITHPHNTLPVTFLRLCFLLASTFHFLHFIYLIHPLSFQRTSSPIPIVGSHELPLSGQPRSVRFSLAIPWLSPRAHLPEAYDTPDLSALLDAVSPTGTNLDAGASRSIPFHRPPPERGCYKGAHWTDTGTVSAHWSDTGTREWGIRGGSRSFSYYLCQEMALTVVFKFQKIPLV